MAADKKRKKRALTSEEREPDWQRKALNGWRGGDLRVFAEALRLCRWHRQPPAAWMVSAGELLLWRALSGGERRAYRDYDNHVARWEAVTKLMDRGYHTWEQGRAAVSEQKEGTDEAGSDATMKASYELIAAAGGKHVTFDSYKEALRRRAKKKAERQHARKKAKRRAR